MYHYKIKKIVKIVDGDTVDVLIDLGFYIYVQQRIRMQGYDAPEVYHPKSKEEYEKGVKVTEELARILNKYKDNLYIKTKKHIGIYGRYTGEIFYIDESGNEISINKLIEKYMQEHNLIKEIKDSKN